MATVTVRYMDMKHEVEYDPDQDRVGDVADKAGRAYFHFHGNFSFGDPVNGGVLPRDLNMDHEENPLKDGDTVDLVMVGAGG